MRSTFSAKSSPPTADAEIAALAAALFARHPELQGFVLRGADGLPIYTGEAVPQIFAAEVTFRHRVSGAERNEVLDELQERLGDLVEARPEAGPLLRDRTFARTLH
jgi:hypothetical protein